MKTRVRYVQESEGKARKSSRVDGWAWLTSAASAAPSCTQSVQGTLKVTGRVASAAINQLQKHGCGPQV